MKLDQLGDEIRRMERQIKMWRLIAIVLFIGGTVQWLAHMAGP